jgi:hypothetical protein
MTAPTANVLVTNNKDALNDFLRRMAEGTPIPNLLDELNSGSGPDATLFSNYNNPNFISFETATMGSDLETKLEFIDPKNEFEDMFFATENIYDSVLDMFREKNRFGGGDAITSEDIKSRIQFREFYFAFGVGDSIESWSGVQKMFLSSATISPTKSKKITLKFLSQPRPLQKDMRVGLYGDPLDINFLGVEYDCEGYSENIDFYNNYKFGGPIYAPIAAQKDVLVDLHAIVVDTIRDYLKKATNGANVIVVFPDLNKLCESYLAGVMRDYESSAQPDPVETLKISLNNLLSQINMGIDVSTDPGRSIDTRTAAPAALVQFGLDKILRMEYYLSKYRWRAKLISQKQEGIPDLKKSLDDVILGINSISNNSRKILPVLFSEADTTILDYWAKLPANFTVNGYLPNTWRPEKPTVIFGDVTMITNLLYAQETIKNNDPIHWHEKESLGSTYQREVKELFDIENKSTPFGKISSLPDQFGYTDELFTADQVKTIEEKNIPVFRYNTENPNILDLTYNDEGLYLSLLNNFFSLNVNRIASAAADGGVPLRLSDLPIVSKEALDAAIISSKMAMFGPVLSNEEIVEEIINKISPELSDELFPGIISFKVQSINSGDLRRFTRDNKFQESQTRIPPKNAITNYVAEIEKSINKNKDGLTVRLPQDRQTDPKTIIQSSVDYIAQAAKTINIKTLPFFNISTRGLALQNPCIVFYQDAPVLAQQRQKRTGFNNFLTGVYALQGFRHKIGRKVESEFLLAKVDTNPRKKSEDVEIKEGKPNPKVPSDKTYPIPPPPESKGLL